MIFVPDTSVIVDGRFVEFMEENVGGEDEIIIPEVLMEEIEHQANRSLSVGFSGLKELKKIRKICEERGIKLRFCGDGAEPWQIKHAREGEIDNLIRVCAQKNDAILVTGDRIQRDIAKIKGIRVEYLEAKKEIRMRIEDFFTEDTMSVHIKPEVGAYAKRGKPGDFSLLRIGNPGRGEIEIMADDIIERARMDEHSFIELDLKGATIVQLREYRIAITRPPFSDSLEITAVRPIVKLKLKDYDISDKLRKRLEERAEGILVSGSPGAGKSTFVQALAEYYASLNKIVKTMEKPRDLVLEKIITQYTALEGSMEKTGDILLLVRPDYTIFDEMRTTDDFRVFMDLRLAGVGMVGVVHATRAIDAIQRFIGRVELGVIPQIVDTVIHIRAGEINHVLTLNYVVKIPTGMREEDLARPVIEVRNLEDEKLLYEIYSFGEQIVVVPVKEGRGGIYRLAERKIEEEIKRMFPGIDVRASIVNENRVILNVNESRISSIIGKKGRKIAELEEILGVSIDVEPMKGGHERKFEVEVEIKKKTIRLYAGEMLSHRKVMVFASSERLFDAIISSQGYINLRKSTANGRKIIKALKEGRTIYVEPL